MNNEYLTSTTAARRIAFIALVALLFGLLIPGMIAAADGILRIDEFYKKMEVTHGDVIGQYNASRTENANIRLEPFYPDLLNVVWPVIYFCLATLIFVVPPAPSKITWHTIRHGLFPNGFLLYFICVVIPYRVPVWIRNFWPQQHERRLVYAYPNWDISPASFLTQEMMAVLQAALIVAVWVKWINLLRQFRSRGEVPAFTYATDPDVLRGLAALLVKWQVSSVLIMCVFAGSTGFYYEAIYQDHDKRYIPQAIVAHLLWALTWIIVSLPLLRSHHEWVTAKTQALADIADLPEDDKVGHRCKKLEFRSKMFEKLQPFSVANLVVSALVGFASFVFPLIKAIWK